MLAALLGCSLIFGLAVIWLFSRERLSLYHPLVILCLWHVIGYLYFPWKLYLNQNWEYLLLCKIPFDNDLLLAKTLLLIYAGFLAVILGYSSRAGIGWSQRLNLPPIVILPRVALGVGLLTLALVGYAILRYHTIPGVYHATATFMTQDELERGIYTSSTGYVVMAPNFLIGIGLIWFLVSRQEQTRSWQCLFWVLVFFYLFLSITKGYSRFTWVTFLFGMATLWLLTQHRRWPTLSQSIRFLPVAVIFLLIFNISGTDRGAWRNMIERGTPIEKYADPAIQGLSRFNIGERDDMSTFEYNVFQVWAYPEMVGYEWGRVYINNWFIAALPRVLFPDKNKYYLPTSMSSSNLVALTAGPASGLYLDFYRNFGIPGLILGCFLFGVALRGLWQLLVRYAGAGRGYHYLMVLFAGFMASFPQLLRDGLGSMGYAYFFVMTPILLTIYLSWRHTLRPVPRLRRKGISRKAPPLQPGWAKGEDSLPKIR